MENLVHGFDPFDNILSLSIISYVNKRQSSFVFFFFFFLLLTHILTSVAIFPDQ